MLDLSKKINKLTWERYLTIYTEGNKPIPIFGYQGFDPEKLYDTVPELDSLHTDFLTIEKLYLAMCDSVPEYKRLRAESESLMAKPATKRRTEQIERNKQTRSNLQNLLFSQHPYIADTYKARQQALIEQKVAIVRFLTDYFNSKNELLPLSEIIPHKDLYIAKAHPEIQNLQLDYNNLVKLRSEVSKKIQELKYGKPYDKTPQLNNEVVIFH